MVWSPGEACSTFGIVLTVIDVVAMSPWNPPIALTWSGGEPAIWTESYVSGAPS